MRNKFSPTPSVVIVTCLVCLLSGCAGTKAELAREWTSTAPQLLGKDFTGKWHPVSAGSGWVPTWDPMVLIHEGTRLHGTFADYELLGVGHLNSITVFGLRGGSVWYTWKLSYSDKIDALIGNQCSGYHPDGDRSCTRIFLEQRE